jgi:urea ABC transporter permease protein UrtB
MSSTIIFSYLYQFIDSFTFLVLASLGMSIIYGMMGITNMAQGELIMFGAYVCNILMNQFSLSLPIAIVLGSLATAFFGLALDRLILRHLYDRPLDSIVVTWGISIALVQLTLVIFGSSMPAVNTPLGSFTVGGLSYSYYKIVLFVIALLLILATFVVFRFTRFGLYSRATMQNRQIANCMGINSELMNAMTFALGSALAGFCGGLYLPTMSLTPDYGSSFLVQSFVTVLVGGSEPLTGTVLASLGLGVVNSVMNINLNTFYGKIGILVAAIIFIRFLPKGFSGVVKSALDKRTRRKVLRQQKGAIE